MISGPVPRPIPEFLAGYRKSLIFQSRLPDFKAFSPGKGPRVHIQFVCNLPFNQERQIEQKDQASIRFPE